MDHRNRIFRGDAFLAQAILRQGMNSAASGMNPMDLKRGVDQALAVVVADIKAQARTVSGSDEVGQVGTIAANGEADIGRQIADAMQRVGNEGVITVEENKASRPKPKSSRACSSTAAISAPT